MAASHEFPSFPSPAPLLTSKLDFTACPEFSHLFYTCDLKMLFILWEVVSLLQVEQMSLAHVFIARDVTQAGSTWTSQGLLIGKGIIGPRASWWPQVAQTCGSYIRRFKQTQGTLQADPASCGVRRCPTELRTPRFLSFPLQLPVGMPQEVLQELISARRTGNGPQGCTRSGGGAAAIRKRW